MSQRPLLPPNRSAPPVSFNLSQLAPFGVSNKMFRSFARRGIIWTTKLQIMRQTPSAAKRPSRFRWPIRIGIALVIYTIIGFFLVPAMIKSQMLKRLPALTKRQVAIEQVTPAPAPEGISGGSEPSWIQA